jgi:hypothetical protein
MIDFILGFAACAVLVWAYHHFRAARAAPQGPQAVLEAHLEGFGQIVAQGEQAVLAELAALKAKLPPVAGR